MVYKARLLISGRQKIALALLLAAVIGFLMYYPRITEAILAFLLGGVVPGTNIVVSPDIVLILVVAVFVLGTASMVLRMYFKAAHGKRNFRIAVQAIESEVVLPVARDAMIGADPQAGVEASSAVRKRHAAGMFAASAARHFKHAMVIAGQVLGSGARTAYGFFIRQTSLAAQLVWRMVAFIAEALFTLLVLLGRAVLVLAKAAFKVFRWLLGHGYVLMRTLARSAIHLLAFLWRHALPALKRLDSWLEVQVRKAEAAVRQWITRCMNRLA